MPFFLVHYQAVEKIEEIKAKSKFQHKPRFYGVVKDPRSTKWLAHGRKHKTRHSANPPVEHHVGWVMDVREHRPRTSSMRFAFGSNFYLSFITHSKEFFSLEPNLFSWSQSLAWVCKVFPGDGRSCRVDQNWVYNMFLSKMAIPWWVWSSVISVEITLPVDGQSNCQSISVLIEKSAI